MTQIFTAFDLISLMTTNKKDNPVLDKSFELAKMVYRFSKKLHSEGDIQISDQVLRCGTSVGANIHEAQNAQSKADFIHRLKIAAKENSEFSFWILLMESLHSTNEHRELIQLSNEISRLLSRIISSTKSKLKEKDE